VPLRVVLIGGVALILAGLVYVLSQSAYEQTGTDAIKPETFAVVLPAGATVCQGPQLVTAKTGRVGMVVGAYGKPGPPLALVLRQARVGVVATGGLRAGWKEGSVHIPLAQPLKGDAAPQVCLHNAGRSRVALAGVHSTTKGSTTRLNGKPIPELLSLTYTEKDKRSGWSRLGDLASRVGDAHGVGSWLFWAAIVLSALAAAGTVALVARSRPEGS
jgi:hypothetical protein